METPPDTNRMDRAAPWLLLALGGMVIAAVLARRADHERGEEIRVAEDAAATERELLGRETKRRERSVAVAEATRSATRRLLKRDHLLLRSAAALHQALPEGLSIVSCDWSTTYAPSGPGHRVTVSGLAWTQVEETARRSWKAWVDRLTSDPSWALAVHLRSDTRWTRSGRGDFRFRTSFDVFPATGEPR